MTWPERMHMFGIKKENQGGNQLAQVHVEKATKTACVFMHVTIFWNQISCHQIGFLSSFYSSSKCTAVIVAAQGLMAIETPELSPYRYYNMSIRLPVLHCLHCVLCYRY